MDRIDKKNKFAEFFAQAKTIFKEKAKNDKSNVKLDSWYNLCIVPGGRMGGMQKDFVEIFYGKRAVGQFPKLVDGNFVLQAEIEYGATLQYYQAIDGNIHCSLIPAGTSIRKLSVDMFLLDYITNPEKLWKKANGHWKSFIACMEHSSIDGNPNLLQKINMFYLNNFKKRIISGIQQNSNFRKVLLNASKWIVSGFLGGCMIFAATMWLNDLNSKRDAEAKIREYDKLEEILSVIKSNDKYRDIELYNLKQINVSENDLNKNVLQLLKK